MVDDDSFILQNAVAFRIARTGGQFVCYRGDDVCRYSPDDDSITFRPWFVNDFLDKGVTAATRIPIRFLAANLAAYEVGVVQVGAHYQADTPEHLMLKPKVNSEELPEGYYRAGSGSGKSFYLGERDSMKVIDVGKGWTDPKGSFLA